MMFSKSIAQDKGCLPFDLLILNVALAFFSAILSVVAFSQLQYLISAGGSNDEHTAAAFPKILFLAAFLLLLSFWVDLCHQTNDEEDDNNESCIQQTLLENSTNELGSSNTDGHRHCCSFQNLHVGSRQKFVVVVVLIIFVLMISFSVIIWIGAGKNFVDSSIVAQVYEDLIAVAILLVGGALGCYGLLLFLKLRKVRSERALSEMWKVAGLAVTSVVCFTSSALVPIFTDIPLYYHWHLKKIYGVRAVIFLVLYYIIGSLVPSAFVLWIMRELPPAITHRQEQARIITFISYRTSGTNPQQRPPSASENQVLDHSFASKSFVNKTCIGIPFALLPRFKEEEYRFQKCSRLMYALCWGSIASPRNFNLEPVTFELFNDTNERCLAQAVTAFAFGVIDVHLDQKICPISSSVTLLQTPLVYMSSCCLINCIVNISKDNKIRIEGTRSKVYKSL
ncbi:hypothetical protein TIFTF001_024083 [Ficus carica]|uniref:THH1/TOM1/TOM3 domain-containing protein n=1 Tax=Ficus carica TaxID=3494 RepID=A0AA88DGN9_FICCA|nr:hypothetical protein TIFTF001_024083 [Ficus carica]